MAFNWGAANLERNWSTADQLAYMNNKKKYDENDDPKIRAAANAANTLIRNKYGVSEDNYGFQGSKDAYDYNNTPDNPYLKKADTVDFNVDRSGVESARKAIRDFKYNPDEDAAFQAYKRNAEAEGNSAAKSTLNQLNEASGGRNNSYSSTAVAQVKQAYAQKIADKSAELADLAYQKLLDRFNVEREAYADEYNRRNDEYNRNITRADSEFNKMMTFEDNQRANDLSKRQLEGYDVENQINRKNLDYYDTDKKYQYAESDANIENIRENTRGKRIDNEYAPAVYQGQIAAQQIENSYKPAIYQGQITAQNIENQYKPSVYQASIDKDTADANQKNADAGGDTSDAAAEYLSALTQSGLVTAGMCTVIADGKSTPVPAKVAAAGMANGTIGINNNGQLYYK